MSSEVIDLSTQEDIICISDDDHEVKKAEANQVCNTHGFDGVEEIEVLEKSESPPQSQSRNLPLKNEIDIESLKLAFQKTLQEVNMTNNKNMFVSIDNVASLTYRICFLYFVNKRNVFKAMLFLFCLLYTHDLL